MLEVSVSDRQLLVCAWGLVGVGGILVLLACVNALRICLSTLLEQCLGLYPRDCTEADGEEKKPDRQNKQPPS